MSDSYYRALEKGEKRPTPEMVGKVAEWLGANRYEAYQHYLADILPKDVFDRIVHPVVGERPAASAKEALDRKDKSLATYRAAVRMYQMQESSDAIYGVDDDMVRFLDEHFHVLPLLHFIYMKDGEVSENELESIRKANGIVEDLASILREFQKHRLAKVTELGSGTNKRYHVRRFRPVFRLPPTAAGRALRARWIKSEVERSLADEEAAVGVDLQNTLVHAQINCYRAPDQIAGIENRILDLLAELNAGWVGAEDAVGAEDVSARPFFVSVVASPRPNYFPSHARKKRRE